jgi:hypothetical protein
MNGDRHVIPVGDLREHNDRSRWCWCGPTVIMTDEDTGQPFPKGRAVVVHHSADGRELVEAHGLQ